MKVLYYLIGSLIVLYLLVLFYESKREKEFLKQDLQEGSINFVNTLQNKEPESVLMNQDWEMQSAQKYGITVLDEMDNTIQGDLKQVVDDVRGAVPLRKN